MSDYEDNDSGIIDMSKYHVCHDCKSDDYIISAIPKGHWAYNTFKTTKIRICFNKYPFISYCLD